MLHWLNAIGNQWNGGISFFGLIYNLCGALGLLYGFWKIRKKIIQLVFRVREYLASFIGSEYREAYQKRKIQRLCDELNTFRNFRHEDEMQCLSNILSRLCTAAVIFFYLFILGAIALTILQVFLVSTLEKEILKLPIHKLTGKPGFWDYFYFDAMFPGMIVAFVALLSSASSEAIKLSKAKRDRRIDVIVKRLLKLGISAEIECSTISAER